VAVKVLQERFAPDSGTARRFADEVRIAAQLQHPGIPPVHDLGALPDGRPFLAMKLIKGQTLEELLAARPDVASDRGRFVAAFEAVCQALAYAHAHGVIHRDLKPANVMVGAFGEVQVMDWGLAKVLTGRAADAADPGATAAGTQVVSRRDSDGPYTQAGSVLGTPAFMPPEQAAGLVAKVDARSDVFGLGAVLAAILTGRPPFAAASAETARGLAARGKVEDCFARLDGCGADPELIALCQRCLAPEPADRPADAGAVARAVAALRAAADERARRAELERVQAEAEKAAAQLQAAEQRKRRRVQLALCAALGVLLLGGGAVAWWSAAQAQAARARQGRNAEAVTGLLDQCEEALRGGDAARAALTLEAARKRAQEGGADEAAARLQALDADLALLRDLDKIDQFRWTPVVRGFPDAAAVGRRYREALGRSGADPDATSPEAAAARASGSAVRGRITAAWDWLLRGEKTAAVRAALQAVDADPFRDEVRDAARADDGAKIAELAGRAAALEQPPEFTAFLGGNEAIGVRRRRQLLEAAARQRPGDLGLLMALGKTYPWNQQEGSEQRLRWYQAAVAAAPTNPAAHNGLGVVLHDRGDLAGAEAAYREVLRLDPKYAPAHSNLGTVLHNRGDLAGAEAAYRAALRLDPEDAYAHTGLGNVLRAREDLAGAEAAYREALRLKPTFTLAHSALGFALQDKGDLEGAIAEFQEALRLDPKYLPALANLPRAERMRALLSRLPAVLAGQAKPETPDEACAFARLCAQPFQKRYAAAARLFDRAFTADPKLAADLQAGHRYNAACYAVRAAVGEGIDAPPAAADRAALRQKALGWLRADLALRQKQAAATDAADRRTAAAKLAQHWLADTDLAGMREPQPLAKLPAAERAEWEQLWADVKATLAEARKPAPPPAKE
jgi:Flp pilus assembly protein TadD